MVWLVMSSVCFTGFYAKDFVRLDWSWDEFQKKPEQKMLQKQANVPNVSVAAMCVNLMLLLIKIKGLL